MDYCLVLKELALPTVQTCPSPLCSWEAGPLRAGGSPPDQAGAKGPGKGLPMGVYEGPGLNGKA